jgi:type IV pilin
MANIMRKMMKNRLALSTVITTLIILVVSVLLAGVVTYFAINVVSTRVQQESLQISYAHVWCDAAGKAVGGLVITNTGGRDVVINQIEVRGQPAPLTSTYTFTGTPGADISAKPITGIGTAITGPVVLGSGKSINVYITSPGSVTTADIGTTISFAVFTAQATYYQETNVQASSTSLA